MTFMRLFFVVYAVSAGIAFLRYGRDAAAGQASAEERASAAAPADRLTLADTARERRSPAARYAVACVAFAAALGVLANLLSIVVGYAMLCLALAARAAGDQIAEERAPRRRAAIINRSRRPDPVIVTWMLLTLLSSLALVPYVLDRTLLIAAIPVAACVATTLAIAWRIATAPPILLGDDLAAEQVVDRETRAIRTGNTCFLAVAAIASFTGFIGGEMNLANYRIATCVPLLVLAFGLLAWRSLYARRLTRAPLAS